MLEDRCNPLCLVRVAWAGPKTNTDVRQGDQEHQGLWATAALPAQQGCSQAAAAASGVLPTQGLDMLPADGRDDAELQEIRGKHIGCVPDATQASLNDTNIYLQQPARDAASIVDTEAQLHSASAHRNSLGTTLSATDH